MSDGMPSAVVVDCGTFQFKAGLSKSAKPDAIVQSPSDAVGDEEFWNAVLEKQLCVSLLDHPVILGLPPLATRRVREDLCQLFFEQLGATALYICSCTLLSMTGSGLSTAVVVDVGHSGASAVPVEEGYPLMHCCAHGAPGGRHLCDFMTCMVKQSHNDLLEDSVGCAASVGNIAVRQLAHVASDFQEKLSTLRNNPVEPQVCMLPDGQEFSSSRGEGFMCGELLFDPSLDGSRGPHVDLASLAVQAVKLCDINLRSKLLDSVLLTGGASELPGLPKRLEAEVRGRSYLAAPGKKREDVIVYAPVDRTTLAWRGGANLAECDVLQQLWVSRESYNYRGPSEIHRKFL